MLRLAAELFIPKGTHAVFSWSLQDIYEARNQQMVGHFRQAARMAESMRTDDAIFVARKNRLAPSRCIKVAMVPAKGTRGEQIANEADALYGQNGIGISQDTVQDIHGCLVDHGVAFGYNVPTVRADGTRVDFAVKYWPIEWVRWDPYRRCFMTQTEQGPEEPIIHGDGRWIIFKDNELEPFKQGTILSACLVWARHAFGNRDWAKGATAAGTQKIIGALPEGVALQKSGSKDLTDEANAMLGLLRALVTSDLPIGIKPAGSSVEFLASDSTAWQVYKELVANAESAAARLYCGTDASLGSKGGAPGVDVTALLGVLATWAEGDLKCIQRGLSEGTIEPWTAINFGDSTLAPIRKYMLPDQDADAERKSYAERKTAFNADVKAMRENGFVIDQPTMDALAKRYGVEAPTVKPPAQPATPAAAAPALRPVA